MRARQVIESAFSSEQCALLRDALPQLPVQRGELGQMGEERETRRHVSCARSGTSASSCTECGE